MVDTNEFGNKIFSSLHLFEHMVYFFFTQCFKSKSDVVRNRMNQSLRSNNYVHAFEICNCKTKMKV